MRRLWAFVLLAGLVAIGAGSSSVLAGSGKTTATYWNNAITASSGGVPANSWLSYGQSATWTFNNVSELRGALSGSVALNFKGLSKSIQIGGGSGYSTSMKVVVTGAGTTGLTTTLANPYRPHVAYSNSPGVGWDAYASLTLPTYAYQGANSLTVKVTSMTSNTLMHIDPGSLFPGWHAQPERGSRKQRDVSP